MMSDGVNVQSVEKSKTPETVREIFQNLSYGPAPEADNVAQAWLEDHHRKFGHFIDNAWVNPDGRKTYETKCPATGSILASTVQGVQEDVDIAVAAAKKAYKTWSKTSGHHRARILYSIARHVQKHMRLISVVESMDNGKPIRESRDVDIPVVARHLYHHAGWAQLADTEMSNWKSVGVVGAIVPWNFPLMLLVWKVCPALAMGNTVVLKPATYTRLTALLFAEICAEAGLPPGVFNVITGPGSMGSMLATHPDVDKVAFTGSTEIGQVLRQATAGSGKKLSLELGGKSPVIVFESADLDSTVEGVVDAIWFNQGQVCSAGSRLLVQESIYDKFIAKLKERMTHLRIGDCLDKVIDMGALVDETQMKSIEDLVQSARLEGAEVYQACSVIPKEGLYYPPTLITGVQTVSRVVVEEIFGPVAVVLPFRTCKEAIELGNNTKFGLGSSVWTENVNIALEVAMNLKAGSVWINCHNMFDAAAGFGGYRQSGFGRDGGKEGLYEYVRPKWESRPHPAIVEQEKMNNFGSVVPCRPTIDGVVSDVESNGHLLPSIDRTYKMYYGGAQQRPDAPYARPIRSVDGKVIGHVGEGNRKDIRNAVEAAHRAAPGWGKRAAHNRAQIVYYMAENLELRRDEFAGLLMSLTGCTKSDAQQEVDLSINRLFHWGAYADKYGGSVQETTLYGATVKVHEPIGVIGIACPDERPLLAFISLFAPAVIRSNCVVIVPSEKYPLLALSLYQVGNIE
jgi:aldehyde dehydrogenase (NAD+)